MKNVIFRPCDQPWSNTRLLLRKKNRNYSLYKKINSDYISLTNQANTSPEIITRYLTKKNKAYSKAREAANASNLANRRAKFAFYNSVNSTMNNHNISAKKKFGILLNLMKNNKFSVVSPLNENGNIINDPKEKSQIFNNYFTSKSKVSEAEENPPYLEKKSKCSISVCFEYFSFGSSQIDKTFEKVSYFPLWNVWKISATYFKRNLIPIK